MPLVWSWLGRGKTNIYVPKVEWPLTTKRVLTMEFIHGLKINDTKGLEKQGIDVKEAAGLAIGTTLTSPRPINTSND